MKPDELVEEGGGLQRALLVGQQQGQIEESRPEVLLQGYGVPEPSLGVLAVVIVHRQHPEIKMHPLVIRVLRKRQQTSRDFKDFMLLANIEIIFRSIVSCRSS